MLIVTRPAGQAEAWVQRLGERGVSASALPLIGIAPLADPAAQQALRSAAEALPRWRLVMFVSPNAVASFVAALPGGWAWPRDTWAGCTGEGTRAALLAAGVPDAAIRAPAPGAPMDSEALWQRLREQDWAAQPVLIVRGEEGRDWLGDTLRERGAVVQALAAYRRTLPVWDPPQHALFAAARTAPSGYVWLFSSSEAVRNLQAIAGVAAAAWGAATALATHPRIGDVARRAGFGVVKVIAPALDDVAQAFRGLPGPADRIHPSR